MHEAPAAPLARHALDRSEGERLRPRLVEDLRADEHTRVLAVDGDALPVRGSGLHLFTSAAVYPSDAQWAFLGRGEDGSAILLCALTAAQSEDDPSLRSPQLPEATSWQTLRSIGGTLDDADAGLAVEAVSLARWLVDSPFCPACGAKTELRTAGWSRSCGGCGKEHFPRTDPAVIVAISDGERLLLGANAAWGGRMYSCFAGFVEAGESLEHAVHREILEEAGVRLRDIRYAASQAWPYPRSLMLGFHAIVAGDGDATPDGEEILDARWFSRDEIGAALAGGGDVALPGHASIARMLIEQWYRGERA